MHRGDTIEVDRRPASGIAEGGEHRRVSANHRFSIAIDDQQVEAWYLGDCLTNFGVRAIDHCGAPGRVAARWQGPLPSGGSIFSSEPVGEQIIIFHLLLHRISIAPGTQCEEHRRFTEAMPGSSLRIDTASQQQIGSKTAQGDLGKDGISRITGQCCIGLPRLRRLQPADAAARGQGGAIECSWISGQELPSGSWVKASRSGIDEGHIAAITERSCRRAMEFPSGAFSLDGDAIEKSHQGGEGIGESGSILEQDGDRTSGRFYPWLMDQPLSSDGGGAAAATVRTRSHLLGQGFDAAAIVSLEGDDSPARFAEAGGAGNPLFGHLGRNLLGRDHQSRSIPEHPRSLDQHAAAFIATGSPGQRRSIVDTGQDVSTGGAGSLQQ